MSRRQRGATAPASGEWTCPTCTTQARTAFCPRCGERPLEASELTLRGLSAQAVEALTNIDGRLLRSVRYLVTRPGELTVAYRQGWRKPFIGPIALFLLANVLFFAIQALTDFRVFAASLELHMHDQIWQSMARTLVARRLEATGTSLESYRMVFDEALPIHARSLIGLMVVPMALLLPLVFRRAKQPMAVHVVFSLHFHAFLLLLFCVPVLAVTIGGFLGGDSRLSQGMDDAVTIALLACCATQLWFATARVYAARGLARVVQTLVMTASVACVFLGYKFALFLLTLATT